MSSRMDSRIADRATGKDPFADPLAVGNTPLDGRPELQAGPRQGEPVASNPSIEIGIADLTSPDVTHLRYTRIRVEYDCTTGDVRIQDPDGMIGAYLRMQETVKTVKGISEYADYVFEQKNISEQVLQGLAIGIGKLIEPVETSPKADVTADSLKNAQLQDANAFDRGLVNWPTFRTERISLDEGAHSRCNMPDFDAPGIDRTFR